MSIVPTAILTLFRSGSHDLEPTCYKVNEDIKVFLSLA